jgi:hypothetical protein
MPYARQTLPALLLENYNYNITVINHLYLMATICSSRAMVQAVNPCPLTAEAGFEP